MYAMTSREVRLSPIQGRGGWREKNDCHRNTHQATTGRNPAPGRILLAMGAALLVLVGILFVDGGVRVASAQTQTESYIVKPGDTLWNIALIEGHAAEGTPTEVQQIMRLNHMASAKIYPGERLLIPQQ